MSFIVQWYDPASEEWRKFGLAQASMDCAKTKAKELYELKEKMIDVRVRREVTVFVTRKEVKLDDNL